MKLSDASFWMAGRLATDCVEISNDPASLDKPGFWAVVCTFEGEWICARFATVVTAPLTKSSWGSISTTWHSSQSRDIYQENVIKIKEKIAAGDIYQVNLCRVLTADSDQSLQGLSNRLQSDNPAPYSCYLNLPNLEIASASPELFLEKDGANIKCTPIKGTSKSDYFVGTPGSTYSGYIQRLISQRNPKQMKWCFVDDLDIKQDTSWWDDKAKCAIGRDSWWREWPQCVTT